MAGLICSICGEEAESFVYLHGLPVHFDVRDCVRRVNSKILGRLKAEPTPEEGVGRSVPEADLRSAEEKIVEHLWWHDHGWIRCANPDTCRAQGTLRHRVIIQLSIDPVPDPASP